MTHRICFIVELFLSGTLISSGQPEKESTSINKSPTPVMYAWSICTRIDGSISLGNEYKVVSVKFLISLHVLYLFIYSSTFHEYFGHHASNFIHFCGRYSAVDIIEYTITNFLCVSGVIIRSPLQITACSIVNLCLISLKVKWRGREEEGWSMPVIGPLSAMRAWWALLDMDPNLSPDTDAWS